MVNQPDIEGSIECPACHDITFDPMFVRVNEYGRRDIEYSCACGHNETLIGETPCQ